MEIRVRRQRRVCIIDCAGSMTLGTGDLALRKELRTVLESGERRLILNYSGLGYMDSAGVGETVACSKRAFEQAAVIKILLAADGVVPRIFGVTGLDKAFEIFDDEDEAVASFWR